MILYLDTSAFIKLYVNEPGAEVIRAAVAEAVQVHAHWVAYPEMRSALARLHRMGRQSVEMFKRCKRDFERDWELVSAILPDERMLRRAGELAERFSCAATTASTSQPPNRCASVTVRSSYVSRPSTTVSIALRRSSAFSCFHPTDAAKGCSAPKGEVILPSRILRPQQVPTRIKTAASHPASPRAARGESLPRCASARLRCRLRTAAQRPVSCSRAGQARSRPCIRRAARRS